MSRPHPTNNAVKRSKNVTPKKETFWTVADLIADIEESFDPGDRILAYNIKAKTAKSTRTLKFTGDS